MLLRCGITLVAILMAAGCAAPGAYRGTVEFGRTVVVDQVTSSPALVRIEGPDYPRVLLDQGVEGTAVIGFTVDERGYARDVKVIEASHPEFGDAAVATVKTILYRPARHGAMTVRCAMEITFIYRLE